MLPAFAINAVAMIAMSLGLWLMQPHFSGAPQILLHVTLALGIMPLILAAIIYFSPVLMRGSGASRWLQGVPLLAWLGAVVILGGFGGILGLTAASHVSVMLSGAAAAAILFWMRQRARAMLGSPHPCFAWYLAALGFLAAALLAVLLMGLWPSQRAALRLFHLHANMLGFVGLAAIGTLQVLLPTAAGYADQAAAGRLTRDLKFACGGAILLSIGAASQAALRSASSDAWWATPIMLSGAALYLIAPLRMGRDWLAGSGKRIGCLHGAAPALVMSCVGLVGLVIGGIGHMLGRLSGSDASLGFIVAFLLPLVSGAASQLLPVWLRPGPQSEWHQRLRSRLGNLAGLRTLLMVCGGFAVVLGWHAGLWLGLAAIVPFAIVAIPAWLASPDKP